MPRTITAALAVELAKTVTSVGYLIQINASQILRWSNLGDVTYLGVPWVDVDFAIEGLSWDSDRDPECSLQIQNLDNAIAALFLNEAMADVTVDLYQFARGALASGDASQLARFVLGNTKIKLDKLEVPLIGQSSLSEFSPRRRIDQVNGFYFALPRGTQLVWENEILIAEPENG